MTVDWEDVAQTTFVKMMLGIERLQSSEIFESWLFKIARNSSLDLLRRRKWRRIFIPWDPRHDPVSSRCARVRGSAPGPSRARAHTAAGRSARTDFVDARKRLELRRSRTNNWIERNRRQIAAVPRTQPPARAYERRRTMKHEGFPWTDVGPGPKPRLQPDFASRVIEQARMTQSRKRRARIGIGMSAGFAAMLATLLWMRSTSSDQQTVRKPHAPPHHRPSSPMSATTRGATCPTSIWLRC